MSEEKNEPLLGKLGAGVVTTVIAGVLVLAVSFLINAPSRVAGESAQRDTDINDRLSAVQRQLDELRVRHNDTDRAVGELAIKVEQGTGDRYTGTEARLEGCRQRREPAVEPHHE